jgi:hypothetical protein
MLNYIFPKSLDSAGDRVEEMLRLQRLNVGFSRAKEKVHFVLSKPVEEFTNSIGRALMHFKNELENKKVAGPEDTDPESPMEKEVREWIIRTKFFQVNQDQIELIAQFPVGEYLRQLDPTYHHPSYRCDFLMRYDGPEGVVNVIIEYDGFAEHFVNRSQVTDLNYDQMYRPEDIERQMIIESYGYRFLRINKFNSGDDPVATLSERFFKLIKAIDDTDSPAVGKLIKEAEDLENGEAKACTKCGKVKPRSEYQGLTGRICFACKKAKSSSAVRSYSGRKYYKRWGR